MRKLLLLFILSLPFFSCDLGEPPAGNFWEGRKVQVYFTDPGYNAKSAVDAKIQDKIKMLVDSAKESVDLCIMGFSEPTIFSAIYSAWKRGVTVRFVGDFGYLDTAEYQTLIALGIQFRVGNKNKIINPVYK